MGEERARVVKRYTENTEANGPQFSYPIFWISIQFSVKNLLSFLPKISQFIEKAIFNFL
jgi:hypothetical protein